MPSPVPTDAPWRKSSFSASNASDSCVEVAFLPDGDVALRDTKNRGIPPHRYTGPAWAAFVAGVRAGDFGRA
jgi:hypothetical protein